MIKIQKKLVNKTKKWMKRKNIGFVLILTLFATCILINMSPATYGAQIEEKDPKEDLYKITLLDFLYIIGDEYPDRPHSVDDAKEVLEKLVVRSVDSDTPSSIDITNVYINTDNPLYTAVIVQMDDRVRDLNYVRVLVILEDSNDHWIVLSMEYDSGTETYLWTSENFKDNVTVGGINDNQIGIAFPRSQCNYRDGDDFLVISYTFRGDFSDPFHSLFYYDFCPNSEIDEVTPGKFEGYDPLFLTGYISELARYLFGWMFPGFIPFLFLIALFLALFEILKDRRNRICHYIGLVLLILCAYPIIMFMLSLNIVGTLGILDITLLFVLLTLVSFLIFIPLSLANRYIKRYYIPYIIGGSCMITLGILYLMFYAGSMMWSFIVLTLFIVLLWIGVIILGSNPKRFE